MIDEATKADPFFSGEGLDIFLCNHFFSKITMIDDFFGANACIQL